MARSVKELQVVKMHYEKIYLKKYISALHKPRFRNTTNINYSIINILRTTKLSK